ncbi:hypothetical protein CKA49_38010 [Pseudomonas aeruginosa]|nr:hypothetical protein CKA49_38010 [Pseudomonas aeruginosa]
MRLNLFNLLNIAGGGEELSCEMTCEFDAMGALSTKYNETPSKASRTYDKNRDGFVIAGGGGIVVVEELEHPLHQTHRSFPSLILHHHQRKQHLVYQVE